MLSKVNYLNKASPDSILNKSIDLMTYEELLNTFYFDNYDLTGVNYDKESYIPKTSFYDEYFSQNQKKVGIKFLQILGLSYIGGAFFGFVMMMFQMMGQAHSLNESLVKYENMADFRKMAWEVSVYYIVYIVCQTKCS